jgi:hypothetical protein
MTKILIEVDLAVSRAPMYESMIRSSQENGTLMLRAGNHAGFEQVRVIGTYGDLERKVREKFTEINEDGAPYYTGAPIEVTRIIKGMAE